MPEGAAGPRAGGAAILTLLAAVATISLAGIGLSLTLPLLSIRMQAAGYSAASIGINTALAGLANVLGAPLIPWLAGRIGLRLLLAGAVVLAMAVLAGFAVLPIPCWFPLRFLFGAAIAVLFVVSEFWILTAAPTGRRGLVTGGYATTLGLGFAAGPLLLRLTGTDGLAPFVGGIVLFAAAGVPIALAGRATPRLDRRPGLPLGALLRAAPLATLAALVFGVFETALFSLLPIYALRLGLSGASGTLLVTFAALGNVVFQLPLGLLGDRLPRPLLMLGCGLACATAAAAVFWLGLDTAWLGLVIVAWSGIGSGLYTLGLAALGDRYSGPDLASANSAMVSLYALGLVIGPPVLGQAMDWGGPAGLPLGLLAMFVAYSAVAAWRLVDAARTGQNP